MAIRIGTPWMAAAGGFGQGALQGGLLGMEMAQQRQKAEQDKQKSAMALLMQGLKNVPDDPQQGQAYMDWLSKFTGMQLPAYPQVKPFADRFKEFQAEAEQLPGLTPEQKTEYAWQRAGLKPPKGGKGSEKHYMMTPKGPVEVQPGKYHNPPAFLQSGWTFGPGGERVDLAPGYRPPPPLFKPEKPDKPEKPTYATSGGAKRVTELENLIRDEKDPAKRQSYIDEYEQTYQGKVNITPPKMTPGKIFGGTWPTQVAPEDIKFKRPSLQMRGVGGEQSSAAPGMVRVRNKKTGKDELVTEEQYQQILAAQGKK